MNWSDMIGRAIRAENKRQDRDRVFHHLEQAERILNSQFGGVGVQHLDDCRKDLMEEMSHETY